MEVGEVGVYLGYPVGLDKDDGSNKEVAGFFGEEGLDLHPGDDVV